MKNKNFIHKSEYIFALSIIFVLFSGVVQVKSQESEIEKLVKEVANDSQKGAIFNYSYLMKVSFERHKFGGRKFTRLYEAILPSRFSLNRMYSHLFVLLKDSEKMISDEQIMLARKNIAKELEKAESEEEKKPTETEKLPEDGGYWTMGVSANSQRIEVDVVKLLKKARLSNLQRKQIEGRSVVLIEFAPNPASAFEKPLSYLSKIEGQIWIDEIAKRIIKIEGFATGEFAKLKEKTDGERQKEIVFLFSQTKVAEGFWFPQNVRLNFAKHPEIFANIEVEFIFSNYNKGTVEIQYTEDATKTTESTSEKP